MPPSALLPHHARYDALSRLASATSSLTGSSYWSQSYTYDGFGNPGSSYDVNNHADGEDANGNPGYVPLPAYGTSAAGTYL